MDIITLALAKKYANKKVSELAAVGFAPAIVTSLPTSDINEHTLYLVPASDGVDSNGYLEYLYIDGKWECVGSTVVDFSMIGNVEDLSTEDKTTLVAAINEVLTTATTTNAETKNYVNTKIEETTNYVNTKITETTNYINEQINIINNNMESRVFQGNILTFSELTEKEQKAFDIAVVEPLAELEEEEISLVDSMVGGDATETIVDMSENEIHDVLDNIIGEE